MSIIEKLERQIDALIQSHSRQKLENKLLREKQSQLVAERNSLVKKHSDAAEGIRKLLEKLKTLEQAYDSDGTS